MKERILRLCKRLDKFSFEEIATIADDINESVLELALIYLIDEKKITKKGDLYFYNKDLSLNSIRGRLPQFFQHHSKLEIDLIIKGFCADVEVLKMINLLGVSNKVINNFYQYFRTMIYEEHGLQQTVQPFRLKTDDCHNHATAEVCAVFELSAYLIIKYRCQFNFFVYN